MRFLVLLVLFPTACATTGSAWIRDGYGSGTNNDQWDETELPNVPNGRQSNAMRGAPPTRASLVEPRQPNGVDTPASTSDTTPTRFAVTGKSGQVPRRVMDQPVSGRVLGRFRNTYYDFPVETDYGGDKLSLHNAQCQPIAQVHREFFEALCVQGSGQLASGSAVSFNRRDCACAELCPRTKQRICFDALDSGKYPWGRGATGAPITPLLTVAVDSSVIPLGTALYIPEYRGLPLDSSRKSLHDGCFVAQDRGLRVTGQHVDIFTGQRAMTELWNALVPSNNGVTVVLDSPACARTNN